MIKNKGKSRKRGEWKKEEEGGYLRGEEGKGRKERNWSVKKSVKRRKSKLRKERVEEGGRTIMLRFLGRRKYGRKERMNDGKKEERREKEYTLHESWTGRGTRQGGKRKEGMGGEKKWRGIESRKNREHEEEQGKEGRERGKKRKMGGRMIGEDKEGRGGKMQ